MAEKFGIDFGTTNSVASIILHLQATGQEEIAVLTNREDLRPHPSVIWYHGNETIVGRQAKEALGRRITGVAGDFVRSPKTLLTTPHGVNVGGVTRKPVDLVSDIFKFIRADALSRNYEGELFNSAIVSIPVTMKGHARRALREAALKANIQIHQFIHEPLAALYGHLRNNVNQECSLSSLEGKLILVFDWGGGTLDLTLCQITKGILIQIANLGDSQIGGDQFDRRIEQLVRQRYEALHSNADWNKFQPSGRARLIQACEDAKIALSERQTTSIFAPEVFAVTGDAAHIEVDISREDLDSEIIDLVNRGLRRIEELLAKADISDKDIEFCLATGGTMAMPTIREGLIELFGPSRCHFIENAATVISEGCAWIAHDNVSLSTAKSLSLLHAGDVFIPTIPSGTLLPKVGETIQDKLSFYCVDPRDGFAKFLIARSRWPDDEGSMIPYGQVAVRVDPDAKPLHERLSLEFQIDQDLVVSVKAISEGTGFERSMEIHDLEFGLSIETASRSAKNRKTIIKGSSGDIRVKSNITPNPDSLKDIPGDLLKKAFPYYTPRTRLQKDEEGYYLPCSICDRSIHEILRDGCERCASNDPTLSLEQAKIRKLRYNEITAPETWTTETSTDKINTSAETEIISEGLQNIYQQQVETLGFSVRVINCMKHNGVELVEDLLSFSQSQISEWRSLGRAGLREIITKLEGLGISLKS